MPVIEAIANMNDDERDVFIGKLVHIVTHNPVAFKISLGLIEAGELSGYFYNVKFGKRAKKMSDENQRRDIDGY